MRDKNQNSNVTRKLIAVSEQSKTVAQGPVYDAPVMFVIGESRDLLRGSGRHKYDDTGSRGFVVG